MNPCIHLVSIHPCFFWQAYFPPTGKVPNSQVVMHPFDAPLRIMKGGTSFHWWWGLLQQSGFVVVNACNRIVFDWFTSNVLLACNEYTIRAWSMLTISSLFLLVALFFIMTMKSFKSSAVFLTWFWVLWVVTWWAILIYFMKWCITCSCAAAVLSWNVGTSYNASLLLTRFMHWLPCFL